MFTPTLDWGSEWLTSLVWIAKAFAITAVALLVVLTLIARFTAWGRMFWRVTSAYFKGRDSVVVWGLLALLLLSTMISVRIDVVLSFQGNDMLTSIQTALQGLTGNDDAVKQSGIDGFWSSLIHFAIVVTIATVQAMLDIYIMQRFIIRWRTWLTDRLTGDWLDGKAYYRSRFLTDKIDNPDQRLQQDIDVFTAGNGMNPNQPSIGTGGTLLFGAVNSMVTVVSFTPILWGLSGPLTLFGVTLPRALFWIALAYVFVATVIAVWIGRPLIQLSFVNEATNAAFRYALVRLRDAAEAVGFYRGENAEQSMLSLRFAMIVANYRRYVRRTIAFSTWNLIVSQAINTMAYILQAPRLFAGQISLGDVNQSSSAFNSISTSLSFFRNVYDSFASFRAVIIRLHGLVIANEEGRALPTVTTAACVDGAVELDGVEVRTPNGQQLINPLDMRLAIGDTLVVTGKSGSGKTTLLRSLAELWPFTSGTLTRPCGPNETMFLSQLPYVPLGDLRAVVSYPCKEGTLQDSDLHDVLISVALPHLVQRLDEELDWAKVLSPGEQQRIAFARILLTKPKAVFLDESTSALDEGLEMTLYQLVRTELPDTILVSVSHRKTVEQHHTKELHLTGGGEWQLSSVGGGPVPI